MLGGLISLSMKARVLTIVLAAVLVAFGIDRVRAMPVDTLPEFTPPLVEIQTEALGLSATEVEQLITVPLEADLLSGVPWLESIRSDSIPGLSSIELLFEPGTDILKARQVVTERLAQAPVAIPNVSKSPQMLQPRSSVSRFMVAGMTSNTVSLVDMSVLARWTIMPYLMGVPGVANVSIWGQRDRQLQVQVDPNRLHDQKYSLIEVIETTANALWVSPLTFVSANTPGTAGFIDTPNQRLGIRHLLPISTPDDLAQIALEERPGLKLGDVANIVEDHQPLIGDAFSSTAPGLVLVVEKFPEADTLTVTKAVEQAFEDLQPGLTGIEIDYTLYRPATFLQSSVNDLALAAIVSFVLVTLVLGVFMFDWRALTVSVVTSLVSLAVAALVLSLMDATLNIMLVAGLVLGVVVVVDEAVIEVDNHIRRRRSLAATGLAAAPESLLLGSALEMRGPMVYAVLMILLSALPVYLMDGLSGAFFPEIATAYLLSVVAAMAVTLTLTPALSVLLLSGAPSSSDEPHVVEALKRLYRPLLTTFLNVPVLALAVAVLLVVAGLVAVPLLRQPSLVPPLHERDVLVHWDGAPGTSQPEMMRIAGEVASQLEQIEGVRSVGAHVGRAITSDLVVNVNSSELWVSIDDKADYGRTIAAMENVLDKYPGLSESLVTYPEERVRQVFTGSKSDLTVRIYGQDETVLKTQAEKVRGLIAGLDGVQNAKVETGAVEPAIEIKVDLGAAARNGIKPGDVRRTVATLMAGITVGSIFDESKVFDVVVWSTPETRENLTSLQNLVIDTPSGVPVRLADVADVRVAPNLTDIKREKVARTLDITADVHGRSLGSVASEIEDRLHDVPFPLSYHAKVLGDYKDRQANRMRIAGYGIAALVAVVLLQQALFGAWRLATLTVGTAVVSLSGGALGALLDGRTVSIGSYAGLWAVMAISLRTSMLLLQRYRALQQGEDNALEAPAILDGSCERFGPVLTTAVAATLGLLPLALIGHIHGQEIVRPMTFVVVGGLITSTVMNLFVLPAVYMRWAPSEIPETQLSLAGLVPAGADEIGGGAS